MRDMVVAPGEKSVLPARISWEMVYASGISHSAMHGNQTKEKGKRGAQAHCRWVPCASRMRRSGVRSIVQEGSVARVRTINGKLHPPS